MEQNQDKKFVCEFCNKSYPCGKSLGGHLRTHLNNGNSFAEAKEEAAKLSLIKFLSSSNGRKNIKRVAEAEPGGGQSSAYGLRENPKKTKRFSDLGNDSLLKEMICKECGKAFESLKGLCGHMACHSEKERVFQKFDSHSGNSEKQKLIIDSQSDTETSAPSRRRRSKRIRYKTVGVYSNNSISLSNGCSSSVSAIEQEQEEVAMCLMMLSRDSGCKKGLNSVADSSDNNSVVSEAKLSSIDVKITIKNDMKCVSKGGEFLKMKKQTDSKLKSAEADPSSDNSDSGYFRNGPKNNNVEFKKLEAESGSGFEGFDAKFGKSLSKFRCVKTEFPKDLISEVGDNRADRTLTKYDLRSAKNDYYSPEFLCNNSPMADSKVTKSSNGKSLSTTPRGSSSNAEKRLGSKKNKGHECPFCFRVFKSGQALGGHKRSHFVGGSEDRSLVITQDAPEMPALIDLNLPAPVEKDAMANVGLVPW